MSNLTKIIRIAAWVSQGFNVFLPYGHQDQTLSARAYDRHKEDKRWHIVYNIMNLIFFWQRDHCKSSYESDIIWAEELIERYIRRQRHYAP